MRKFTAITLVLLPLGDLLWNLSNLNIGLVDFYGLAAFARNFALNQVWPATPYFPAGYPMLLATGGKCGSVLLAGYFLSALGIGIALWAMFRFLRHSGAGYGWALAAVVLAWISPTCRIVAGSPSVDALFTGVALWFIAAALACWIANTKAAVKLPLWVRLGLTVPALLLPLLRYHGLLVVLPVVLILLIGRRKSWRLVAVAVIAVCLAASFNMLTYQRAFREFPASTVELQVRTGIEISEPTAYNSADELFADYEAFSEHARNSSISSDYSSAILARHTLANLIKFLRRPPVVVALLAVLLLLVKRRTGISGVVLGTAWSVCYALALSPAYYTPRGALLPVMVCMACAGAAVHLLADDQRMKYVQATVVILLLLGFGFSASYARMVIEDRMNHALASRELEMLMFETAACTRESVATADMALLPLADNPWCQPYVSFGQSWISDPAIKGAQREGVVVVPLERAMLDGSGINLVVIDDGCDISTQLERTAGWTVNPANGSLIIYGRAHSVR